jgi:hypothetical protein
MLATGQPSLASRPTFGCSQLAGEFAGREAVLAQLARSGELSGGTYRVAVEDVMASDSHACVL